MAGLCCIAVVDKFCFKLFIFFLFLSGKRADMSRNIFVKSDITSDFNQ